MPFLKFPRRGFKSRRRRPRWQRALLTTLALPPFVVGTFGLTTAYKIYASNRALTRDGHFATMPAPGPGHSVLVFSPHCDDETLGAAGLMRRATHTGCPVHVVFLTNGDGFRVGAERDFHELSVPPRDFVRYAYRRQAEARTALALLGVTSDRVAFLGYPDQGLMPLWTTNWSSRRPFRSFYTKATCSPYADSVTSGAPYSGESLLADIERQMRADRPTDIYVTHPADDHPDHAAASVFVEAALDQLRAEGAPWAQHARLHFYLVHRGDWPCPQGLYEDAALPPPAPMVHLDTQWEQFPLTAREVWAKYAAIKRYRSQTEMIGRLMFSFARRSELFGTLDDGGPEPVLPRVGDGRIRLDGDPRAWAGLRPVALDPAGDSILRAFQGSADLTRVYACRDSRLLYVRVETRTPLSSRVRYAVNLRSLSCAAPTRALTLEMTPYVAGRARPIPGVPGASYVRRGTALVMAVPLAAAGLDGAGRGGRLYLNAETRFADVQIDRTGFRGVACASPSPAARVASRGVNGE